MKASGDTIERIAVDATELRGVFERSRYAAIAPILRFERYFPRSLDRMVVEEGRTGRGMLLLSGMVGAVLAAGALSLWRMSPYPFVYAVVAAIPALILIRAKMGTIYGATSEAARFVELLCFDPRAPIVYLRRFEGEDPPLPSLTSRNSVVGGAANPSGTDTLENLAHLLGAAGPVVGLGRPADTSIEHRIYRLFTPDAHWREVVEFLVGQAKAVLMSYEPSPVIDWELGKALQGRNTILFVLLRDLPQTTVRSGQSALAALPAAIASLDRTKTYVDKVSDKYPGGEHGLLAVVAPDGVRVFGLKMHFQQLWDVIFEEVVHTLDIADARSFVDVPDAYLPVVRAEQGRSNWWNVLAFAAGAAAVAGVVLAL